MRLLPSIVAAGLLASCRAPAEPEGNVAAQPEPSTVAPGAPSAATASSIPAVFHGLYDRDKAACAQDASQYRLRISAGELRYHESIGTVRAVTAGADGALSVAADWQGEGESWSNVRKMSLSPDGALTIAGEGVTTTRVRCPRRPQA